MLTVHDDILEMGGFEWIKISCSILCYSLSSANDHATLSVLSPAVCDPVQTELYDQQ